jgi:hypothetical protein
MFSRTPGPLRYIIRVENTISDVRIPKFVPKIGQFSVPPWNSRSADQEVNDLPLAKGITDFTHQKRFIDKFNYSKRLLICS